jgi:uroporphyrinogen-III synthase
VNVVLTHSSGRFEALQSTLEERGFSVIHHPLVRTESVGNLNLEPIMDCAWWTFSSLAAVEAVAHSGALKDRKVAAIGRSTARGLQDAGANVEFTSIVGNAASFAREFIALKPVEPIGLLEGDHTLLTLSQALSDAGLAFRRLLVYRTFLNDWNGLELPELRNAIVLMSPTAVNALPENIARVSELVALGETTAASIEARGWRYSLAQQPKMEAIIEALEALKNRRSDARFN